MKHSGPWSEMGTAGCACELSRHKWLTLFSEQFPNYKSKQRKLKNTAATNDPEIAENHSKQFEFAKSLQTNTADTNEYTLPSLAFSICQVQPRIGGGVNWSSGQTRVEKCLHINHWRTPPGGVFTSILLSLTLTSVPPPPFRLSSSPSSVNGLPL